MLVNRRVKNMVTLKFETKPIFKFDENGKFETEDQGLIKRLLPYFDHEENEIVNCNGNGYSNNENKFKCKKCGQECESKGLLLAHYRIKHKKGE